MKAEITVMLLQAKERQRLPANHEKLGERHEQILPHSPGSSQPCGHVDLGLLVPRTETIHFCCLSPPVGDTLLQKPEQTNTDFSE